MARRKSKRKRPQAKRVTPPPERATPSRATVSATGASPLDLLLAHRSTLVWLVCLTLVALFYLALKSFTMNPYAGDEYIYLYQAKLVSEGVAPYSGFAMAHPPGQCAFTALLFKLFGYHFLLGRFLPVLWCLAGGIALALFAGQKLGRVASVAAFALYLLSYEPLRASSHYTGVNMTVALLLGAVLAQANHRIRLCAALCVFAVFTRLYAIPVVFILVVFTLIADHHRGLRLMIWGACFGVAAFIAIGLWAGFDEMIHNMVLYHLQKTPMKPGQLIGMRNNILFHNAPIAILFGLSLIAQLGALAWSFNRSPHKDPLLPRLRSAITDSGIGAVIFSSVMAIAVLIVLVSMDRVWMYYFIPSFPFAAVAGGWLVAVWIEGATGLVRAHFRPAELRPVRLPLIGGAVLLIAFAAGWVASPALEKRLDYYERYMAKPPDQRVRAYTWQSPLLAEGLDHVIRSVLWEDERVVGQSYPSFTYYLWHESRLLDITDSVVEKIEAHTPEEGEIFGDSGTVPLFALLSGRRIAANEVDTNFQRYRSGNADPAEIVSKIDSPRTSMIILRRNMGIARIPEVLRLVKDKYNRIAVFRAKTGAQFYLFSRRKDA